jgi:hypothetical protein
MLSGLVNIYGFIKEKQEAQSFLLNENNGFYSSELSFFSSSCFCFFLWYRDVKNTIDANTKHTQVTID